jgi:hypothetical protein
MAANLAMVTVDCADPQGLARFWAGVLDTEVAADWGEFVMLAPSSAGVRLGFQRVPEPAAGKNRLHLDLETDDRAGEVRRLVGLGAEHRYDQVDQVPGLDWSTLADPEGNVFCVGQPH